MSAGKSKLTLKEVIILGLLGAVLFVVQQALSFLANVELVSLLLIVYVRVYGARVVYPLYLFVLLEGLRYGFGQWFFNYLYVWLPLVAVAWLCRRQTAPLFWAVISGFFGLLFGALCSLLYLLIGGVPAAVAYWIGGIPFDLIHAAGNFVAALLLVTPLQRLLTRLSSQ